MHADAADAHVGTAALGCPSSEARIVFFVAFRHHSRLISRVTESFGNSSEKTLVATNER